MITYLLISLLFILGCACINTNLILRREMKKKPVQPAKDYFGRIFLLLFCELFCLYFIPEGLSPNEVVEYINGSARAALFLLLVFALMLFDCFLVRKQQDDK